MEPMDTGKGCDAFEMLVLFLTPYDGYELWLDRFLKLWDTYYNPVWSTDIMNLIGPTARNNIGKIDWEPHMPSIFTRIMRALELPVNYKNMSSVRNQHFTLSSAACEFHFTFWVVQRRLTASLFLSSSVDRVCVGPEQQCPATLELSNGRHRDLRSPG